MRRRAAEAHVRTQTGSVGKDDRAKYHPGKDPLEIEETLPMIQPHTKQEGSRMTAIINAMLKGTKDKNLIKALTFQKTRLSAKSLQSYVGMEFLRDFWSWLIGRGTEEDHKKTPWYRQSLADDPEVAAYIDAFVTKMHDFRLKLARMGIRRPTGINESFVYFKYLVRGQKPNESNFLDDWDLFIKEFGIAREKWGQDYQDRENFVHPHEVAPYNTVRAPGGNRAVVGQSHDDQDGSRAGSQMLSQMDPPPPAQGDRRRGGDSPSGRAPDDDGDDGGGGGGGGGGAVLGAGAFGRPAQNSEEEDEQLREAIAESAAREKELEGVDWRSAFNQFAEEENLRAGRKVYTPVASQSSAQAPAAAAAPNVPVSGKGKEEEDA